MNDTVAGTGCCGSRWGGRWSVESSGYANRVEVELTHQWKEAEFLSGSLWGFRLGGGRLWLCQSRGNGASAPVERRYVNLKWILSIDKSI